MRRRPFFSSLAAALCGVIASQAGAQSSRRPANPQPAAQEADHMVSWVVLFDSALALDEETLRARLDEAFPGEFVAQRDQGSFVVEGPEPGAQFLIQSRVAGAAGVFMLNAVPAPYTHFSNFAAFIPDRTTRQKARAQRRWLSIDLMMKNPDAIEADAYRFIGRALAKLAPRDAAYLVHPTRQIVVAFDEDVRRRLASGEYMP
jgi:hypothetical protein